MGELVQAEFGMGLSGRAEAKLRGCSHATVDRERQCGDLPYTRVKGVNGSIHRARQLKPSERRKRDRRIKVLLGLGLTVSDIVDTLGCGRGTVSRVAAVTPNRRKAHKLSRRAWKDRGVTDSSETG